MKEWPWHSLLWALFFPVFLFVHNLSESTYLQVFLASLVSVGLAVSVLGLRLRAHKDLLRAGVETSGLLIVFFSFGRVHGSIHAQYLEQDFDYQLPGVGPIPVYGVVIGSLVFLGMSGLYWLGTRWLTRSRSRLGGAASLLQASAAVLLIMQTFSFFSYQGDKERLESERRKIFPSLPVSSHKAPLDQLPDIYFIVPDGYARADRLREFYHFDNSTHLEALKERGFQVLEQSEAAYYWTFLSLSSTLNMGPVNGFYDWADLAQEDRSLPYYALRKNRVLELIHSYGYEFHQTASTFEAARDNPFADRIWHCDRWEVFNQEYFRVLSETTLARPLFGLVFGDLANCHLNHFENVKRFAAEKAAAPRFLFAHFVLPHHPYLFDKEGNVLKLATVSNQFDFQAKLWRKTDAYVEQLQFVSKKLLEVVDAIRKHQTRPSVIVIASDHGSNVEFAGADPLLTHQARLSNFVAVSSPDPSFRLPDPMNLADLFRYVLGHHLGADLPPLEIGSYHSYFYLPYIFGRVPMPSDLAKRAGNQGK